MGASHGAGQQQTPRSDSCRTEAPPQQGAVMVAVLGPSPAGKTALLQRLTACGGPLQPALITPTQGMSYHQVSLRVGELEHREGDAGGTTTTRRKRKVLFLDTSGKPRFASVAHSFCERATLILLCAPMHLWDPQQTSRLIRFARQAAFSRCGNKERQVTFALVGTMSDIALDECEVTPEEMLLRSTQLREMAAANQVLYVGVCSALKTDAAHIRDLMEGLLIRALTSGGGSDFHPPPAFPASGMSPAAQEPSRQGSSRSSSRRGSMSFPSPGDSPMSFDGEIKVVVVGPRGSGKTSLIQRDFDSTFTPDRPSTTKIDFKVKHLTLPDGRKFFMEIWDTITDERLQSIVAAHCRRAHGILMCLRAHSLQADAAEMVQLVKPLQELQAQMPILVVGTMLDLSTSNGSSHSVEVLSQDLNKAAGMLGGFSGGFVSSREGYRVSTVVNTIGQLGVVLADHPAPMEENFGQYCGILESENSAAVVGVTLCAVHQDLEQPPSEWMEPSVSRQCREIDLTGNRIKDLSFLCSFPHIRSLVLDHNSLESLSTFPADSLSQLSTLWLNFNLLSSLDELLDVLEKLPALTYLSLLGNPCTKFLLQPDVVVPSPPEEGEEQELGGGDPPVEREDIDSSSVDDSACQLLLQAYRSTMAHRLPKLQFLDATPISPEERLLGVDVDALISQSRPPSQ